MKILYWIGLKCFSVEPAQCEGTKWWNVNLTFGYCSLAMTDVITRRQPMTLLIPKPTRTRYEGRFHAVSSVLLLNFGRFRHLHRSAGGFVHLRVANVGRDQFVGSGRAGVRRFGAFRPPTSRRRRRGTGVGPECNRRRRRHQRGWRPFCFFQCFGSPHRLNRMEVF